MDTRMIMEVGEVSETELLARIADGDEQAFLTIFKTYSPLIRPFARKIALSESAAEDILQETFIRVWLNRDKLPEVQNLRSWIFTVAANECMRFMRNKLTYERKTEEFQYHQSPLDNESPIDFVQTNEIGRIVQGVVNAMPPQRQTIYQMSRNQGLKPSVIAEQLSLSVGTVKNVLSKAVKEVRERLLESGITLALLLSHFY